MKWSCLMLILALGSCLQQLEYCDGLKSCHVHHSQTSHVPPSIFIIGNIIPIHWLSYRVELVRKHLLVYPVKACGRWILIKHVGFDWPITFDLNRLAATTPTSVFFKRIHVNLTHYRFDSLYKIFYTFCDTTDCHTSCTAFKVYS